MILTRMHRTGLVTQSNDEGERKCGTRQTLASGRSCFKPVPQLVIAEFERAARRAAHGISGAPEVTCGISQHSSAVGALCLAYVGTRCLPSGTLGAPCLSCSPDPVGTSSRACDECGFVKILTAHSKHRRRREVRNASAGDADKTLCCSGNSVSP